MSFAFLTATATDAVARSPMERQARAAGASFEVRDGWIDPAFAERVQAVAPSYVAFADASHLRKYEKQGDLPRLEFGKATVDGESTWLPMTNTRALILGGEAPAGALDVSTAFGVLRIAGPLARETFARFTALDLRPAVLPLQGFRPGSVARTPGAVLREDEDRFLMLFGAALGQYVWTVVDDAARRLGGGPVSDDALVREASRA